MQKFTLAIILAVMALATLAIGQTAPDPAPAAAQNAASATLKIIAPQGGERLAQQFVNVQYQITNPGATAQASPNFRVQLDNQDAVLTTATQQNFSGLAPGVHNVTVQLVDANNTPVTGATASVQFTIVNPNAQSPAQANPRPLATTGDDDGLMPSAGSPLPLLSVIGFGVLVGGIVSALKTR